MHKEFGSQVDQSLFKGLVAQKPTQATSNKNYGPQLPTNVARINQTGGVQQARFYAPSVVGNSASSARSSVPYMSMAQNLRMNKPASMAYPALMTPAPVAQISRAQIPQMSMGGFRPNLQVNQSQSLYGATMANRTPSVKKAPKRAAEVKMYAVPTNFNLHAKWGSIGGGEFGRSSDVTMAAAAADEFVPDMQRRSIMNLVLLGGAAVPVGWMGGGFVYFFVPPTKGGGSGGVAALDANGDQVKLTSWTKAHQPGDRQLVQGLKGDAHYLISTETGIRDYAINAVCTHLGCVVPWNRAANKYMCPCHGSQYDETGKVVRGPAPLSLALAHVEIKDDVVTLGTWTEEDFRTGLKPWWK